MKIVRKSDLEEAVAKFKENSYWKKYLEDAPSDRCKEYIRYGFYYSDIDDDNEDIDEVVGIMDKIEAEMSLEEWKYLHKYADGPFKGVCKEKISELSK